MGVNAETTTRAFREADVEHVFNRPYVPVPYIRHVFTAVDPAGGGASAFAVSSIGLNNTGDVIVRNACIFFVFLHYSGCNGFSSVSISGRNAHKSS